MEIKDSARIQHILEAADDIKNFLEGHDASSLESNKMLLFALSRAIEIIGEASSKVSIETRARYPSLPWGKAIGMRNLLIHAYLSVNKDILWRTVTVEVPEYVAEIKRLGLDQLED